MKISAGIKQTIIIPLFFAFQAQAVKKYFVCDVLKEEAIPSSSFDGKMNWFDVVIHYEKTDQGKYKASLGNGGRGLGLRFEDNILSSAYLERAGEQQNVYGELFYRETFSLFRFDLESQILIQSYVYYVSKDDYNKNFNEPLFTSKNKPFLFDLVPRKAPKDYVKIAWDKSRWKCHEISFWRYWYFSFGLGLLF